MSLASATPLARRPVLDDAAKLRAENRELRHRVTALEDALLGAKSDALAIPLPRLQLALLRLLMHRTRVSSEPCLDALEAICPSHDGRKLNDLQCLVYRLRASLRPHGVAIQSSQHGGYWIEPSDKVRLRELFGA